MGPTCTPSPFTVAHSTYHSLENMISQFNMAPSSGAPFTGLSAFAHKGGIHVSAVNKIPDSYQHIDPAEVGNVKR